MITGFDVSHWQTPSNQLAQQRAAFGDKFAIVKSTDGTATDPASKAHLANFARVGLACGAYIFYRSTKDPAAQARKLLEATKDHVLPMGLWLDYENGSGVDLPDDLLTFLTTLDDGYTGTVGIYTGPAWWRQTIGNDPRFARFPLWLAQYPNRHKDGTTTPDAITTKAPAPWDVADIWQFTDSAGHLDRNVCTAATFAALTHSTPDPEELTVADIKIITDRLAAIEAEQKRQGTQLDELHHEYAAPIDDKTQKPHGNKAWQIAKSFLAATGRKG